MDTNGSTVDTGKPRAGAFPGPSKVHHLEKREEKLAKIRDACTWRDIERLRALATSEGGLISDSARRQAWPLLLGSVSHDSGIKHEHDDDSWKSLPKHRDEDQVQLDVDRAFVYYPNNQSVPELDRRKEELSNLIKEVLRRHDYLCYFQGYHDICQVFLLVLEPQTRADAVSRLSVLRIRDFMLPTLAPALDQLRLIPAILDAVNPDLCKHLSQTQPFFALSGTLTMYAHDIQEYGQIARLFDILLAQNAIFSLYLFVQIILQRSDELFETPADEPEMLHSILSKLPQPLDIEHLVQMAATLFEQHPPETLRQWRSISSTSVLKTARWPEQTLKQSADDGEMYFHKQVKELRWAEQRDTIFSAIRKYRKPAGTIGAVILVGVLSMLVRRLTGPSGYSGALWRHWTGYQGH